MPVSLPSGEPVYSMRLGFATSALPELLGRRSCHALIHHGGQSCFRISQVLREECCTLFRLPTGQKFLNSTMNGNQAAWIIVPEIDEHHTHPQFTQKLLVKGLQAPVAMKANQQAMKL
jgi:hypothetical protein